MREDKHTLNLIYNSLKEHFVLDYSDLKKKKDIQKESITIELSNENNKILKSFVAKILLKDYSPNTLKTYQNCFSTFLFYAQYIKKNVSEITKSEIESLMLKWKTNKKPSASYQDQMINAIKFYYKQVIGRSSVTYNIARVKKPKQLPKVISEKEFVGLLNQIQNLKHRCIVSLIYSAGLRMSEILNLKVSDIQSSRNLIIVKGARGKKDRVSLLSENVFLMLRDYFKIYRPENNLFEGANGKRYSATSVNAIIKKAAKRANINRTVSAHVLRHSFATHLLENGTDIRHIQKLLGHGSRKTTEIYTHITKKGFENLKSPFDNLHIDKEAIAHSETKGEAKHSKRENINEK